MKNAHQKLIEKATYKSQTEESSVVRFFDSDFREIGYSFDGGLEDSFAYVYPKPIDLNPQFRGKIPMTPK